MFIDTHIDTLWAMSRQNRVFHELSEEGHVDLYRAREAGLLAGLFTGFPTESHYATETMVRRWLQFTGDPRSNIKRIKKFSDLQSLQADFNSKSMEERKIGAVLCLEGAAGIDTGLNRLYIYHDVGLRSMGLTWNEENQFATGQAQGEHRGLSKEGFDLLDAMEALGIMVDVSHLNDKSFWDVANHTNGPIIASHSNIRTLASHHRNLSEEMAKHVIDSGGTIGINLWRKLLNDDEESASAKDAIRMFEKIISLGSVDNVHLGTDLDGATFIDDVKDIRGIPPLLQQVKDELSLSDQDMDKMCYGNIMRVMKNVWK